MDWNKTLSFLMAFCGEGILGKARSLLREFLKRGFFFPLGGQRRPPGKGWLDCSFC